MPLVRISDKFKCKHVPNARVTLTILHCTIRLSFVIQYCNTTYYWDTVLGYTTVAKAWHNIRPSPAVFDNAFQVPSEKLRPQTGLLRTSGEISVDTLVANGKQVSKIIIHKPTKFAGKTCGKKTGEKDSCFMVCHVCNERSDSRNCGN